ncbi:MAG TPA: carboxypeptidase-like regulatory domain-containing protein [Gemmatimonadaceae bacterium]|nr:carboxypeptidase-like regulatory domain-containing protein [Gemmatimonadaceae bacterium]
MPRTAHRVVAFLAFTWACDAADAQPAGRAVFRGLVTTELGQTPVADVEVSFKEPARSVRSGKDGQFIVAGLSAGTFKVSLRHPGYRPIDGTVTLADADTIDWHFDMVIAGAELAPVEVRVNADSARPGLREFERRRHTTSGRFLTESDIKRIAGTNLANIIRTKVPGFDLVRHPSGSGTALAARRTGTPSRGMNECYTAVWMNGQLFFEPNKYDQPPRLEDINLQDLAGAEFYKVSEVPPELGFRSGNCGAMVIWNMVARRKYPPPH